VNVLAEAVDGRKRQRIGVSQEVVVQELGVGIDRHGPRRESPLLLDAEGVSLVELYAQEPFIGDFEDLIRQPVSVHVHEIDPLSGHRPGRAPATTDHDQVRTGASCERPGVLKSDDVGTVGGAVNSVQDAAEGVRAESRDLYRGMVLVVSPPS